MLYDTFQETVHRLFKIVGNDLTNMQVDAIVNTANDIGATCMAAIRNYMRNLDPETCGITGEYANGNGALMRIMPICLWAYEKEAAGEWTKETAVEAIHKGSVLTHNHLRSQMACGIYYFMIKSILEQKGTLLERMQNGMDCAVDFYRENEENRKQMSYHQKMMDMKRFRKSGWRRYKDGNGLKK